MQHRTAYGAEHRGGEPAQTARAHDHQIGCFAGLDQRLRRMTDDLLAYDFDVRVLLAPRRQTFGRPAKLVLTGIRTRRSG
jgi:hypothetical protein